MGIHSKIIHIRWTYILCFWMLAINGRTQTVINKIYPVEGLIKLSEETSIPRIEPGYTLWLPEKGKPKGLIVFTHARRDTVKSEPIIDLALNNQLAVLYSSAKTGMPYIGLSCPARLSQIIFAAPAVLEKVSSDLAH